MTYQQALAYLDDHAGYQKTGRIDSPSLDMISRLCELMGEPQHCAPVVHITGTNGKGSTAQMITRLLMASGLRVGTYTSPHLERVNERFMIDCEQIPDDAFAEQIAAIADLEMLTGSRPGYFDICTAAAFRWFADEAVDVMVIEVGLLGRWDATNVVDAQVAVITNIGLDHMEFAGPTRADIAREKSGIIKPQSAVICGETDEEIVEIFAQAGGASLLVRQRDFDVDSNQLALGGRMIDARTPTTIYPEVLVPLHGRHQAENAIVAITAVEAFFARPLTAEIIDEAFGQVSMPGRFEVMGDPFDMLSALRADEFDVVICCTAPSPRGLPAQEVAEAARRLGCDEVVTVNTVEAAIDRALQEIGPDDALLITGSLYVVGSARPYLRRLLP
jgi:dihydrofolate synthase/folylpolyglutamate synthase